MGLFDDIPSVGAAVEGGGEDISRIPRITVTPAPQKSPLFDDIPAEGGGGGQFAALPPDGGNLRLAREGPSPPVATPAQAALGGLERGSTFNFGDELRGIMAAGGADPSHPDTATAIKEMLTTAAAPPVGLARKAIEVSPSFLRGIYGLLSGDPDAKAAYQVAVSSERERNQLQHEQQPAASLAGEIAGASALPIGAGATAATLPGRIAAGATTGGIMGAFSGAGEGTNLADRAVKAGVGGVTGAVVGGAVPVGVEGVTKAVQAAAAPFKAAANTIRAVRDPDTEAARRVAGAIERDFKTAKGAPPGLNGQEFAESVNSGGPAAIVDLGGETTRALARSSANTSPEARAALGSRIDDRFESQSDRVSGWLNRKFGPSDTGATREALDEAAQKANRPAYRKAYTEGDKPLWSDRLELLTSSPYVSAAMKNAAERGKSRSVLEGFGGFNPGVNVSPSGVVTFPRSPSGTTAYPNLQFWDYTKRALDGAKSAAESARDTDQAAVLGQLSKALRDELDKMVPSYKGARAGAAQFFGAENAIEAGEKFLGSNVPIADAQRAFAKLSDPEKELFRHGFIQSLTQKIESSPDRRNVLNGIAQSPHARNQMMLAMGPQGAREFEAMMRVEGIMDLARPAVQGNSTTARQLAELGLAGGAYGLGTGGDLMNPNPSALMTAVLAYGAAKGKGAIDQRLAQKVGELLASNDTRALRRGIEIVSASHGRFLEALRNFDQAFARSGAQQAPAILPNLQGSVAGRAEGDQQH